MRKGAIFVPRRASIILKTYVRYREASLTKKNEPSSGGASPSADPNVLSLTQAANEKLFSHAKTLLNSPEKNHVIWFLGLAIFAGPVILALLAYFLRNHHPQSQALAITIHSSITITVLICLFVLQKIMTDVVNDLRDRRSVAAHLLDMALRNINEINNTGRLKENDRRSGIQEALRTLLSNRSMLEKDSLKNEVEKLSEHLIWKK